VPLKEGIVRRDPYADFAQRYDSFFGPFGEHDSRKVEFFRQLFAHHRVKSVLDCACGTGRDLHMFHSLGCDVHGSDISEAMLAQSERNLAAHHVDIPLTHADFRELPLTYARDFDAVVCLSSAHLEMPNEHELARALSSMRGILRDGGILIVTSGISDKTWRQKPRFIPEVNNNDFTRLFAIDYFDEGARFNVVDLYHDSERKEMLLWSITYDRVYLRGDMERAIHRAGFLKESFYGSFQFEPYDVDTSDMLIAVAAN
jgi:glycine/sarcosine N-methyltransferase